MSSVVWEDKDGNEYVVSEGKIYRVQGDEEVLLSRFETADLKAKYPFEWWAK
jgi:hypothetical protein